MNATTSRYLPDLWRYVAIATSAAIVSTVYFVVMVQSIFSLGSINTGNISVFALLLCLCFYYYVAYIAARTERRYSDMSEAQADIQTRPEWMYVGDRSIERLVIQMFNASPVGDKINEELLVVTRRDPLTVLWLPLLACWTIAVAVLSLPKLIVIFLEALLRQFSRETERTITLSWPDVPYGFFMLYALPVAYISMVIWLRWVSTLVVLTTKRYTLQTQYPSWFNWLGESNPEMLMKDVGSLYIKQSVVGKLLDYGTLGPDTPTEESQKVRVITKVPHAATVASVLRDVQTTFSN